MLSSRAQAAAVRKCSITETISCSCPPTVDVKNADAPAAAAASSCAAHEAGRTLRQRVTAAERLRAGAGTVSVRDSSGACKQLCELAKRRKRTAVTKSNQTQHPPTHPPSELILRLIAATSQSKRRAYSVFASAS